MVDSLHIGLMVNDIRVPIESEDMTVSGKRINPFSLSNRKKTKTALNSHRQAWNPSSGGMSTSTATTAEDPDLQLQDLEQQGSQDRMIIKQTKTTDVSSYPRPPQKAYRQLSSEV